jgi:hypothetical protein
MGHLPFNFLKSAIFLPVPVSCKLQRQIEARRSRSRDDFDIASAASVQTLGMLSFGLDSLATTRPPVIRGILHWYCTRP